MAVDHRTARQLDTTEDVFDATFARELKVLRRRAARYRGGRHPVDVRGRTVVVVHDRGDEGLSDLAAVHAMRASGAVRIVVAVAVGTSKWAASVRGEADEIVRHKQTLHWLDLERLCERFSPVPDAEVLALLDVATVARTTTRGRMPPPERIALVERPATRELRLKVGEVPLAAELILPKSPTGRWCSQIGTASAARASAGPSSPPT